MIEQLYVVVVILFYCDSRIRMAHRHLCIHVSLFWMRDQVPTRILKPWSKTAPRILTHTLVVCLRSQPWAGFVYHFWDYPICSSALPVNFSISFSFWISKSLKSPPELTWSHSWNSQELKNFRLATILIGQIWYRIGSSGVKYKNRSKILGFKNLD